jgi:hypothetical protein
MFHFKRKEKFDKYSTRGMVYAGVAFLGIVYELLFSEEIRILLIIAYGIVIAFGAMYIWYIEPYEKDESV